MGGGRGSILIRTPEAQSRGVVSRGGTIWDEKERIRCQCSCSAAEWRDLLQSRRQFWPTLTTRHASLVPVSAEALQRERRQMQAKHLWYNVDIRWSDLKDKLEVLAPTGLTRDDIWRHLFLTKQRKNPYEEGCYTGEDLEDVKRKWEAKKEY